MAVWRKWVAAAALVGAAAGLSAGPALAQAKKASLAECAMLIDPFKGKDNAAVKDEAVEEYAPLIKAYWEKGCPADYYEENVKDPALRKRIEAKAPPPKKG
jgi:hypothetical protein